MVDTMLKSYGKYKASGYGDLPKPTVRENMIKLTELLSESYDEFQRVDKGDKDVTAKIRANKKLMVLDTKQVKELKRKNFKKK